MAQNRFYDVRKGIAVVRGCATVLGGATECHNSEMDLDRIANEAVELNIAAQQLLRLLNDMGAVKLPGIKKAS